MRKEQYNVIYKLAKLSVLPADVVINIRNRDSRWKLPSPPSRRPLFNVEFGCGASSVAMRRVLAGRWPTERST